MITGTFSQVLAMPRSPSWSLGRDEAHVWSVCLSHAGERRSHLQRLLSPAELDRAARYAHPVARDQFVLSRAMLRLILGRYLGAPPTRIALTCADTGKPVLPGRELHFNVSHTDGLALVALMRSRDVGVDVERLRACPTHLDMASRFFTPGEVTALRSLPASASESAFFHIWTRKEAFLKALGLGLSHGLERFEVSVPPNDPARILHIDGDYRAGGRWTLRSLEPAPGYVGALAIEGEGVEVQHWPWQQYAGGDED